MVVIGGGDGGRGGGRGRGRGGGGGGKQTNTSHGILLLHASRRDQHTSNVLNVPAHKRPVRTKAHVEVHRVRVATELSRAIFGQVPAKCEWNRVEQTITSVNGTEWNK
jgi:hypothetical protein